MTKRIAVKAAVVLILLYFGVFFTIRAPVVSKTTPLPLQNSPDPINLQDHVETLSSLTPNRSINNPESLKKAALYIEENFLKLGYKTERQKIPIEGLNTFNILAKYLPKDAAKKSPWVIVGAHYDVAGAESPGADDNASGVAGLIELARLFKENETQVGFPIQFVAYSTEEPPYFAGRRMGSAIHADILLEEKQKVRLMYSLEMIGYFSDELFSQKFPLSLLYFFYPWRGNFIGIIGDLNSYKVVREVKRSFLAIDGLPTYSINAPRKLVGIDFSDHRNYWHNGWPAVMDTDTAFLRNEEYHKVGDTPERLNYEKMALVVRAIFQSINDLQ